MAKKFRLFNHRKLNPTRLVVAGFLAIILLGAFLLWLPISSQSGAFTDPILCLFTATSATCVTGLVQVDTALHWTFFGQLVILILIQLGGLGFVTFISLFALALNRRIGLSQRMIMASALNLNGTAGVVRLVKRALCGTAILELGGAAILATRFIPIFGFWKGLWYGVFHSISAFCNAGFDLMGSYSGEYSSLVAFSSDPVILVTIMILVVVGGLGFFVWEDVLANGLGRITIYSRLVLQLTAMLIALGFVFFLAVEWQNPETLGEFSLVDKIINSLFQSVTLRTAGFATLDQGAINQGGQVMSILFMLVGGSSGSTAGGLKTVTVGILLLSLRDGLRGRDEVVVHGRTIPHKRVLNAMTLTLVVVILFLVSGMAITMIDGLPFLDVAFEVASAMGTVGLSTGITTQLNLFSTLWIIALMYLGRVGILSFSIAFLVINQPVNKIHYPTMDIMVG